MTYYLNTDYYARIQKGQVDGHSIVNKSGRNALVPNGAWADVVSYTVPAGHTGYFLSTHITAATKKRVDAKLTITEVSEPPEEVIYWDDIVAPIVINRKAPGEARQEGAIAKIEAYGDGDTAEVSAHIELLIVDNTAL